MPRRKFLLVLASRLAGRTRRGVAMATCRGAPCLQRFEFDMPAPIPR
jgi:hypothetical protein